jgi:hypothetical protein
MTERFVEWIVLGAVFAAASFFAAHTIVSTMVAPALEQIAQVLSR